jgi:hypothetical protein
LQEKPQESVYTTFSEKILDFYKILEENEQFFILFLKKMENLRRFFSIFEVPLPFNVLTLTTCSIKNFLPRH